MNASVMSKEGNTVKFTYEASPERLEQGMAFAYNKNKGQFALPGFRKGKVPRKMVEMQFGAQVLYDDAVNHILQEDYESIIKELDLDVVSRPEIDIEAIGKEEGVKFVIEVTVKPEVTLGEYKGLTYTKEDVTVTEEDIQAEIDKVREQNARTIAVADRAAQNGDIVNISYLGTIDGVPFEGGASDNYDLTLGSHSFIDTFEDQICGHSVGDKFDVNVTFPAEYHAEELAGKPAVFAVELKDISVKELPEMTDEFAQDVSEFDTMDAYKASIVAKLTEAKEAEAKSKKSDELLGKALDNTTMDVPQVMIDNQADRLLNDFGMNMARQGLSLEVYCQYMNTTQEEMKQGFLPTAERGVKTRLMLEKVAESENIQPTEEDITAKINAMAEQMGMSGDQLLGYMNDEDKENVKKDLCVEKAIELIENAGVEA